MAQPAPQPQLQPFRSNTLDALQGMINGILIQTGKALRAAEKNGSRSLTSTTTKLPIVIPGMAENFNQALDELESDIVRAKSVLARDLETFRAKRYALENPAPPVVEEEANGTIVVELFPTEAPQAVMISQPNLDPPIKQENPSSPAKAPATLNKPQPSIPDPSKETITNPTEPTKPLQAPSPPPSSTEPSQSKPIGLGINTNPDPDATSTSAPATADAHDSAIDSLFDIPSSTSGAGDLNFDNMDFSYASGTQDPPGTQEQEQPQSASFDLSTFGNESQDFTMPPGTNENVTGGNTNAVQNKPVEDLFGEIGNAGTGDAMDLDLDFGTLGAEESVFDDMLFGDEGSGGANMEHGEYDNAFFGLDG